jgi:hypothetical protein
MLGPALRSSLRTASRSIPASMPSAARRYASSRASGSSRSYPFLAAALATTAVVVAGTVLPGRVHLDSKQASVLDQNSLKEPIQRARAWFDWPAPQ